MKGSVDKHCECCGQAFTCGGYRCWCGQVPVTDRQFDWIADRYEECLCPVCLEKISAGRLGPVAKEDRRFEE